MTSACGQEGVVVMRNWDGMGFVMGGMVFFGVLLLVGLVVLIVLLVRVLGAGVRPGGANSAQGDGSVQARAILAERYARGEIDTEEYQAKLRVLGGS